MHQIVSLEGPKLFQPQEEQAYRIKSEASWGDPVLNSTIELLRLVRYGTARFFSYFIR